MWNECTCTLFFTLLGIVLGDDGAARIEVSANHDVEYTEALSTDTLTMGDGVAAVRINIYEAVGQVGSRRYMATFDADGHPVDVTDLGKEVDAGLSTSYMSPTAVVIR